MVDRKDPFRGYRFLVEIDGIVQAGFSEVTIPDSTTEAVDYREGKDQFTRKLLGQTKHGNVSLKWGITDSMELYDKWYKLVQQGKISSARRNMAIILLNDEGTPSARWEFENAWPIKYKAPDLSAKGNDVAIETLEVVHEGMKRVKV
ncbi:MAG TPA: phage tail protein [Methanotrichaceae archaeon]|nr:phage tail protein [Methanotrichaceae archaeon]